MGSRRPSLRELEQMTSAQLERAMVREGWSRETAKAAMARMEDALARAVAPARRLIAAENPSRTLLEQSLKTLDKRAADILEDEIIRQVQDLELELYQDVGVDAFEWITVEDDRVCPDCDTLHGQVRSMDDWGSTIPGTPDHVCMDRCRCMLIPAEDTPAIDRGDIQVAVSIEVADAER